MTKQKDILRIHRIIIKEFKIPYQYQHIIYLAIKEGYKLKENEKR